MTKTLIDNMEAIEMIENRGDVFLIDARSEDVYTEGSDQIEGAFHITEQMGHEIYFNLPKDMEYLIYTTEGEDDLSLQFAQFLRDKGFDAYAIEGGYEKWRDSGLPIEPIGAKGTPFIEE